jgi:hypothetical protein
VIINPAKPADILPVRAMIMVIKMEAAPNLRNTVDACLDITRKSTYRS